MSLRPRLVWNRSMSRHPHRARNRSMSLRPRLVWNRSMSRHPHRARNRSVSLRPRLILPHRLIRNRRSARSSLASISAIGSRTRSEAGPAIRVAGFTGWTAPVPLGQGFDLLGQVVPIDVPQQFGGLTLAIRDGATDRAQGRSLARGRGVRMRTG
jgi:hypothetical protein